jgi:hypothetical protein
MFGKLTSIFTTAQPVGVATRDIITGLGAILAMLGVLGFLSEQQVQELTRQAPAVLTALGPVIYGGMTIYRTLFKSSSDVAAEVARQVDDRVIGQGTSAVVETPAGLPNIEVRPSNSVDSR